VIELWELKIFKKNKKPLDFSTFNFLFLFLAICIYISSGRKRLFLAPVSWPLLQRAVFLAASLLQLQYLW
jgi:hypothetical protein